MGHRTSRVDSPARVRRNEHAGAVGRRVRGVLVVGHRSQRGVQGGGPADRHPADGRLYAPQPEILRAPRRFPRLAHVVDQGGWVMGGGSGGGGTTTSQAHAEYPEEFRPLAESAVKEIIGLQGRLPLAEFGVAQPARVAGLSPFTEAGMSLVPSLMLQTPPEQALQQVPT